MGRAVLVRLGAAALLLWLVLSATFVVLHVAPGDPAALLDHPRAPAEQREELRRAWGLDRPLPVQYGLWMWAALRGDWGYSFLHQRPVTTVIGSALPNTLLLGLAAAVVQLTLGVGLGVAAARRAGGALDHGIRAGSLLLYAVPTFWLGLMMILLFSVRWGVFPASHMHSVGADELLFPQRLLDLGWHLVLPAAVLGASTAGGAVRFVRAALLASLSQDHVVTARAKGLGERRVVRSHGLRVAAGPLLQLAGAQLPVLLSGSLVTEVVFAWPGLGRLLHGALLGRDYPLALGAVALSGALVVAGSLIADLAHAAIDPRVRDV